MQAALDALEHELEKLAVEQGTYTVFNFACVNGDRSSLICLRKDAGELGGNDNNKRQRPQPWSLNPFS